MTTPHDVQLHHRNCHLCEAMCGVVIETRGAQIVAIEGDEQDTFSRGHICPKALALKDVHEDPDRLRQPLRRTATGWEPVTWERAFDEIGKRLVELQARHGRDSVATYFGNPQVHSYSALLGGATLARCLRSSHRYSATSVDQLPHHFAAYFMYGHQLLLPIPDIDHTDFFLVIGGNPLVSNGSLMSAPDVRTRLKDLRRRGGRLVVIDPRRTETAKVADQHLFINPETDAWLLLAILHVIFAEGLEKPNELSSLIDGLDQLRMLVRAYPPTQAAALTGIAPETITTLAREFAGARSAVCHARMGASTQRYGALTQWLVQALNIITGNLDRKGGAMLPTPAFDMLALSSSMGQRGAFARRHTRVRGLPEFGGEFPVAALAEEILTPGEGQIRALVTAAGNPVLSTPNGERLDTALGQLDFMVSIDIYLNETTRHAHYILPPTFALERDHYDLIFHGLAIRNTAKYSKPVFPAPPGSLADGQIFAKLVAAIESHDPARRSAPLQRWRSRWLTPRRALALGIRFGPYGAGWNPFSSKLTLGKLAGQPHGVDLGPLSAGIKERLRYGHGRIKLAPQVLVDDLARLERDRAAGDIADSTLRLIGRRDLRSNNSWMHNSKRLIKGPARCSLQLHPLDAAARGITEGAAVRVKSRVGQVDLIAHITDDIMQGVVSVPHGWGHGRIGARLNVAATQPGVSANSLTDEQFIDELCGNAALNGLPVSVIALS